MKTMAFAFSKLWQAVTLLNNNIARKMAYGIERNIKIGKNAQGKEALEIHTSKLLKIEKNIKVRLMLQNLSASPEMKGLGLYEISSALTDV